MTATLGGESIRRLARAVAVPVLCIAGTLVILNGFVFRGLLTTGDVLKFWLPTYCFLGKSVAAGHVPAWNPYAMGGLPFAADPQSGWMYLPAMLLFVSLPCTVAIRVMIVLQPTLAGLGIYWFLRSEGLSRPAAGVGAVVLSLGIAGSELVLSLPFAGALAWTALTLAACSRLLRARTWPARLGWVLATALAWGQIAAAHFSVGLILGTLALIAYLLAKVTSAPQPVPERRRDRILVLGLLVLSALAVNLGFLLPRIQYLPETSIGQGYAKLGALEASYGGEPPGPRIGRTTALPWPLKLAAKPGAYVGAIALALSFAGFWSRRRGLFLAFLGLGILCYLLSLHAVASRAPPFVTRSALGNFWLHNPDWFGLEIMLVLAVLAALGLEAFLEADSNRQRAVMLAPGLLVWGVLPLVLGVPLAEMGPFAVGLLAGGAVLVLATRRSCMVALVVPVMAVELTLSGLLGAVGPVALGPGPQLFAGLPDPTLPASRYAQRGVLASALAADNGARFAKVLRRGEPPGLNVNQAMVFDIQDAGAYNPVQLFRYWTYIRAAQRAPIQYNAANFPRPPPPSALDLLQVGYVVTKGTAPEPGATQVAADGGYVLWRRPQIPARASVLTSWEVVASSAAALKSVTSPSFDPARAAVLEADPGLRRAGPGPIGRGTAVYVPHGREAATIRVDGSAPAVVLIRTPYDSNWHARVDGRPVGIIPADYLMQAVPVPAGGHTITLAYDDPWVGWGVLGAVLAILLLAGAALALRVRASRAGTRERARAHPSEDRSPGQAPQRRDDVVAGPTGPRGEEAARVHGGSET